MGRHTPKEGFKGHEKSRKSDPTKQHSNLTVNDPKEMEICELLDKEFWRIVLRKLREVWEHTDRKFKEIMDIIHEQNERYSREKS